MIYTAQTKQAIKLAFKAHEGQLDKSGLPYILHPLHLAEQMKDETTTIVALLHDVVEDTWYTFDEIEGYGFGDDVMGALALLTHDSSVPYMDYIRSLAPNAVARTVKIADLTHNMDLSRLEHPTEKDYKRVEKYKRALDILRDATLQEFSLADIIHITPMDELYNTVRRRASFQDAEAVKCREWLEIDAGKR